MANFQKSYVLGLTVLLSAGSLVFSSCGGAGDENAETLDTAKSNMVKNNTQKVFYTVPSPIEMATLLQKAGAKYDKDILNDPLNTSKYSSNASRALNLGIYGADLTYTSVFDQTQESMFYLKAANTLADGLGITQAFPKETVQRFEENVNNKDSMMAIISDSFTETDSYLQENDRANVSALVIAGGWIEGLHLAVNVAKNSPKSNEIKTRIAEQKLSLDNLLAILSAYPGDAAIEDLSADLKALKELFNDVKVESGNSTVSTNQETGVATIGSEEFKSNLTDDQFKKILDKVEEIRNKIIK
jgi:hypothetical protein